MTYNLSLLGRSLSIIRKGHGLVLFGVSRGISGHGTDGLVSQRGSTRKSVGNGVAGSSRLAEVKFNSAGDWVCGLPEIGGATGVSPCTQM